MEVMSKYEPVSAEVVAALQTALGAEYVRTDAETLEKWINHIPKKSGNANTNMALELYQKALKEEEDAKK